MYDLLQLAASDTPTGISGGSGAGLIIIAIILVLCMGGGKKGD